MQGVSLPDVLGMLGKRWWTSSEGRGGERDEPRYPTIVHEHVSAWCKEGLQVKYSYGAMGSCQP